MPLRSHGWIGASQPAGGWLGAVQPNYGSLWTGLVSYWPLNEANATDDAVDVHGTNTLTQHASPATATGKLTGARDFESAGGNQYFSSADNAGLSTGDIDFTFACWVNVESLPSFPVIAGKGWGSPGSSDREWVLYLDSGNGNKPTFAVASAGGSETGVVWGSALSVGSWYYIVCWHDSVNNTINIQVNGGTPVSLSYSSGVGGGALDFTLGASPSQTLYWDGLICEVGFWKRVLTSGERTQLYNANFGWRYEYFNGFTPDLVPGLRAWLRPEALDAAGLADGDFISTWPDHSGLGNSGTQTGAARPVYKTSQYNGRSVARLTPANNSFFTLPDVISDATAAEVFVAVKINLDPPVSTSNIGLWTFGSDTDPTCYPYTDGTIYDNFGTTLRKTTVNPTPSLAAMRVYNVVSKAGEWTSFLDGTQLYTTATNTVGWTTTPRLGQSVDRYLDGDIGEFILYAQKLDPDQHYNVNQYAYARWHILAFTATVVITTGGMVCSGSATFTASGSNSTAGVIVTTGPATAAASTTFSPGTHTATAIATVGHTNSAASATFSPGTHTATVIITASPTAASAAASSLFISAVAVTTGSTTSAASATFSPGTHTATVAIAIGHTNSAVSSTFSPGTHTAIVAITTGPATAAAIASSRFIAAVIATIGHVNSAASATFSPGTHTATVVISTGHATSAASAIFSPGTHTATVGIAAGPATAAVSGTFVPGSRASTAITTGPVVSAVSATFSPGTHTATVIVTAGHATAAASATFSPGTHAATVAISAGHSTATAIATYSPGTHTGTVSITSGPTSTSGSSTFSPGTHTATTVIIAGHTTAVASATFSPGTHTATVVVALGPAVGHATTAPRFAADIAITTGPLTGAALATFRPGTHTATVIISAGPATSTIAATFSPGTHTGTVIIATGHMAGAATATFSPGLHTATTIISVGHVTAAGSATFRPGTHTAIIAITFAPVVTIAATTFSPGIHAATVANSFGGVVAVAATSYNPGTHTATTTISLAPVTAHAAHEQTATVMLVIPSLVIGVGATFFITSSGQFIQRRFF
jgi:hypothetical protein